MNDDTEDDLPTALTKLLRNVDGVHTVYATKPIVPSIVEAVVEAVRNDSVGMHLVSIHEHQDGFDVEACIGISDEEAAPEIGRRAHDALRAFFDASKEPAPAHIQVRIGRVG